MIAITFALPAESSNFARRIQEVPNKEIRILHTGVGTKACRTCLRDFLKDTSYDLVISSGFAGAVRDDLEVGDLFLAENFSDPKPLAVARQALANRTLHLAKLLTSPRVIDSPAERAALAQTSGAAAVDMETEVIAAECKARGVPLLSLRVISDTPRQPLPAAPDVLFNMARQQTDFARLLLHFLRHPAAIPRLIQFGRQIGKARAHLSDALITLLQSPIFPASGQAPPTK
jgi:adenosylhomocysteine nucleosidase